MFLFLSIKKPARGGLDLAKFLKPQMGLPLQSHHSTGSTSPSQISKQTIKSVNIINKRSAASKTTNHL